MGKRSRMLRSSSFGATSPLDKLFCPDPADAWEERSAPIPPPAMPPANPADTDCPPPPPHVETDLEVVESPPLMPKMRIASPRGKEAPEGSLTSPVIFFVEVLCPEPSTEDFVPEKPGELFKFCFLCKKAIGAEDDVYMFGYLRAFCSPSCQAEQMMKEGVELTTSTDANEGVELTTSTNANEVSPTYVHKKSGRSRSRWSGRRGKGSAFYLNL